MAHVHELPDGTKTGPDKAVGNDWHDHSVPSPGPGLVMRTELARDIEGHVHTVLNSITGPAIKKKKKS